MTWAAAIREHSTLAFRIADGYFVPGYDVEDVRQEALIALGKATENWRPERGAPFPPFAGMVIRRRLTSLLRESNASTRALHRERIRSLEQSMPDGDAVLADTIADPRTGPEASEARRECLEVLRALAGRLSPTERVALAGWLNGRGYDELGDETGRGRKAIDNALQRVRKKTAELLAA